MREGLHEAEPLIDECRALNRLWMIERVFDFLLTSSATLGLQSEARDLLARAAPGLSPRGLAAASLALADGDAEAALDHARRLQGWFDGRGMRLLSADTQDLAARCFLRLERWAEARDEAEQLISFCAESGYRALHWKALVIRAEAFGALGEQDGARDDFAAAAEILLEMAASMPTAELKASFLSQPAAKRALDMRPASETTTTERR